MTAPSLTLGHCQLLPHESGEEEHEKYIFPLKNGILVKKFFGPFWTRERWLPSTLEVIQVCERVYICASLLPHHRIIRNLFHIYQKGSWKNVITFWSYITLSCVYICRPFLLLTWLQLEFKVFDAVFTIFLVGMHLVGPCRFLNVICYWVKVKFKWIK